MAKKSSKTTSKTTVKSKTTKKTVIKNKILEPDLSYIENDKLLKKVEKYVDKNREKTSKEIFERKSKRPAQQFQEGDLEVMISRIDADSKPKEKAKETSKWILYLIYTIIILTIIIFGIKHFFNSNMPQIS